MNNRLYQPTYAAGRATNAGGRLEPDPIPERCLGTPPWQMWSPDGAPPDGLEFLGAKATIWAWLLPCPCCCLGWVLLVPLQNGGYAVDSATCTRCCSASDVAWWDACKRGELPPRPLLNERARRYAAGAVRRTLGELPDRPTLAQLRRAAFEAGRWIQAGALPAAPAAQALLAAANRAGLGPAIIARQLAADLTAGRARPGRLPR